MIVLVNSNGQIYEVQILNGPQGVFATMVDCLIFAKDKPRTSANALRRRPIWRRQWQEHPGKTAQRAINHALENLTALKLNKPQHSLTIF